MRAHPRAWTVESMAVDVLLIVLATITVVLWVALLVIVFRDLFASPDLSGWAKGWWTVFLVVLPFVGVLTYLVSRSEKMQEHYAQRSRARR